MNAFDLSLEDVELYKAELKAAPLGVYQKSLDSYKLIPASLSPLIIDGGMWQKLVVDAQHFLVITQKTLSWLQKPEQKQLWDRLYKGFSPLERQAASGSFGSILKLVTLRLDLFFDGDDLKILEINATIPAMQAYSDMIKQAYLKTLLASKKDFGESQDSRKISIHQEANNTDELLNSLLAHYQGTGGTQLKPDIAILARTGDSQLAELYWYIKEWQKLGHKVFLTHPEQLRLMKNDIYQGKQKCDLVYRHIFAEQISEQKDIVTMLSNYQRYKIFNPIAAHWEAKALMSIISESVANSKMTESIGLSQQECSVLKRRLPWARILDTGSTLLPDQTRHDCLAAWVRNNPEKLVLKRSTGYGGHNVLIGSELEKKASSSNAGASGWSELIDRIIQQKDETWLVQERIPGKKKQITWITEDGIKEGEVFLDCSLFACTQNNIVLRGGVSRFAEDPIVNIGKGGGLMPFFLSHELSY